ncbi:hypothetical protein IWZ01DRAFT_537543 [Phyllosticta capitalensis]
MLTLNKAPARHSNSPDRREFRSRLYQWPPRLALRTTHSRATSESQNVQSSGGRSRSRTRWKSDEKPARTHIQFPKYQPGGTALRGLGGKALENVHVRKPSPSKYLTDALGKAGQLYAKPPAFANKADLTYISHASKRSKQDPTIVLHPTPRISLQYFVAQYVEALHDISLGKADSVPVVPESVKSWAVSNGYSWEDLEHWAKILMEKSSDAAVLMLRGDYAKGRTPIWVVLLLLKRDRLTLGAFRHLLRFTLRQVGLFDTPVSRQQSQTTFEIDEKTIFLLFVRFLRHARTLLPSAIVPLTKLVTSKINPRNLGTRQCEVPPEQINERRMIDKRIKLANIYNKALKLLALPATPNPYASAVYQERAQFEILRRIADYEPTIPITEEGYRALIQTQLAHVKTDKERLWASLKSKGWPPWKEDRTAMDEDILHEEAISRAGQLLRKMWEAGYPATESDQAASILTGWDLDESPTIQTRNVHYPTTTATTSNSPRVHAPPSSQKVLDPVIWAARVKSTRTLEEAWACFLAYDSSGSRQHPKVYFVMFEKIVADRRRERRRNRHNDSRDLDIPLYGPGWKEALPGDSPDVWPIPRSHRERIDPTLKLPSTKDLLDRMVSKGIIPRGQCLEFLVETAANFTEASYILTQCVDSNPALQSLLKKKITPDEAAAIPRAIFRAYILMLARLWHQPIPFHPERQRRTERPLLLHRALDLLRLKRSNDRHSWNSVLIALSQYGFQKLNDTSTAIMRDAVEAMNGLELDLDQEGFGILCKAFSMRTTARETALRARSAGLRQMTDMDDLLATARAVQLDWDDHLAHCSADSRYLRALFNHLVGAEPFQSQQQPHDSDCLQIPIPHIMHRYVRALGVMYDYEGLLSVADFLRLNAAALVFNTSYSTNGRVRLRAAVVALRVHLEFRARLRYGRSCPAPADADDNTNNTSNVPKPESYKWDMHTPTRPSPSPSPFSPSFPTFLSSDAYSDPILPVPRHSDEQVELARRKLDDPAASDLGGWPSDDEVVTYVLGMVIHPDVLFTLQGKDRSAKEMWTYLVSKFGTKDIPFEADIIEDFINCRRADDDSVSEWLEDPNVKRANYACVSEWLEDFNVKRANVTVRTKWKLNDQFLSVLLLANPG